MQFITKFYEGVVDDDPNNARSGESNHDREAVDVPETIVESESQLGCIAQAPQPTEGRQYFFSTKPTFIS